VDDPLLIAEIGLLIDLIEGETFAVLTTLFGEESKLACDDGPN
jgi:hypothetical protein